GEKHAHDQPEVAPREDESSGVDGPPDHGHDRDAEEHPREVLHGTDLGATLGEPAAGRATDAQDRALLDDRDRHEDGGADPAPAADDHEYGYHILAVEPFDGVGATSVNIGSPAYSRRVGLGRLVERG